MKVVDYLLEQEIVKDLKEFQELYSVRAFKVNDKPVSDPDQEIDENSKIQVGFRLI